MGSFSIWHWLVVLVIVILIFGTKKLKTLGSDLGESIRNFKRGMRDEDDKPAASPATETAAPSAAPVAEPKLLPPSAEPAPSVAPSRPKAAARAKTGGKPRPKTKRATARKRGST